MRIPPLQRKEFSSSFKIIGYENINIKFLKSEKFALTISVSKKVGNAVWRNRIRRIIYEFIRLNFSKGIIWIRIFGTHNLSKKHLSQTFREENLRSDLKKFQIRVNLKK